MYIFYFTFRYFLFHRVYRFTYVYIEIVVFPLLYICLLCDEVILPCKLGNLGFDVRVIYDRTSTPKYETPPPPNMKTKIHIFDLNLKSSYQIASLCYMYLDMGGRIAGKQDRSSLIIEAPPPPQGPSNIVHFYSHFVPYMKNWFSIVFAFYFNSKSSYQITSIF